jgi:sugar lactone lactonase YvrE
MVPKGAGTGLIVVETNSGSTSGPNFEYIYTATVSTLAGTTQGFQDGDASTAKFNTPVYSIFDAEGNILISDRLNHRIRKISNQGVVSTLVGTGVAGSTDGDVSIAQLDSPTGLAFDYNGNLYVAEAVGRIRKITPAGQVSVFAGGSSQGFADGNGTSAQFKFPTSLAFDSNGNLFVADYQNSRIRMITPNADVTTFAGDGTVASLDGTGTSAQLNQPWGLTIDKFDYLYVTEFGSGKIRKITPTGIVSTIVGSTAGYQDGNIATAKFSNPYAINIDASYNLYVADGGNNRIRKISATGEVTTVAGSNTLGFADGDASVAQFNGPYGALIGASGELIIPDRQNFKVRKIVFE